MSPPRRRPRRLPRSNEWRGKSKCRWNAGRLTQINTHGPRCASVATSEWSPGPKAFIEGGRGPSESSGRGWRICPGPTYLRDPVMSGGSGHRSVPVVERGESHAGLVPDVDPCSSILGLLARQPIAAVGWIALKMRPPPEYATILKMFSSQLPVVADQTFACCAEMHFQPTVFSRHNFFVGVGSRPSALWSVWRSG